MRRTSLGLLATITLSCVVVSWAGARFLESHSTGLPLPTWATSGAALLSSAILIAAGWPLRRWKAGRAVRPEPLLSARVAVAGLAGSRAGAAVTGWFVGHSVFLLGGSGAGFEDDRLWLTLASALTGLVLLTSGLLVEHWCVLPPEDDQDD